MKQLLLSAVFLCLGLNQPASAQQNTQENIESLLQTLTVVRVNPCTSNWNMIRTDMGISYGCSNPNYAPFYVPDADSLIVILRAQQAKLAELESRIQKLEAPK